MNIEELSIKITAKDGETFAREDRPTGIPKASFVREVEEAFRTPVEVDGYRVALVTKSVEGSDEKKWFVVTKIE